MLTLQKSWQISTKLRRKIDQTLHEHLQSRAHKPMGFGYNINLQGIRSEGYMSQCGQDKYVAEILYPQLYEGVFVDIGAHDGVSLSNTAFLERQRHWTGLCVEPNPDVFRELQKNRSCSLMNACVGNTVGEVTFRVIEGYAEMLSGIVEYYDARHLDRIQMEIRQNGGHFRDISVPCWPLTNLLNQFRLSCIHYLSIDVEGGSDLSCQDLNLNNAQFMRYQSKTIIVIPGCRGFYRKKDFTFMQYLVMSFIFMIDTLMSFTRQYDESGAVIYSQNECAH